MVFILPIFLWAQTPYTINYQGVARDASGQPLAGQNISIKLSVLEGTPTGTDLYVETHTPTTNNFGLFNIEIGGGTLVSGDFQTIAWNSDKKFLKVEMDPAGGSSYINLGTSQLLGVPYSNYSDQAGAISIYGSGTTNPDKMIITHSPNFTNWGVQYNDAQDAMIFKSSSDNALTVDLINSRVGVALNSAPTEALDVDGQIRIRGGNPGAGKVLTSNANGVASWQFGGTNITAFTPPGCQTLASGTSSFQKIADLGTFTKLDASTFIELDLQTNFQATMTGVGGVIYELRVDGVGTTIGNAALLLKTAQTGISIPGTIYGIFTGLSVGSHTVSLWAQEVNCTATNIMYDAGCYNSYNTNTVIVKEFQ